ncbi:MAG: prephenate dehydrogenase [Betaproteobacteria bacterium CG2_30_68_42]|nr:MAG: prephenate dehydrogenase [Betaproteobacteria bacterium CG2_30_68_42]
MTRAIGKLVVVGVGLIGGSCAAALRRAGAVGEIVGLGRSSESIARALALGVIDRAATDWADALAGADLVLLSMPVGQTRAALDSAAPHLEAHTLVTDAGSTKGDVVAAARAALGRRIGRFVPAHPIAGAEKSGVDAASADLFRGKRVVVTPLAENAPGSVARVRAFWESCGARVTEMDPQEHDRVFAAVSHLPHVLAFCLVDALARRENAEMLFGFAASGFRDFTRIAASHPEMWRDICLANREALLAEIARYGSELDRLRELLAAGDGAALESLFRHAREARNAWAVARPAEP